MYKRERLVWQIKGRWRSSRYLNGVELSSYYDFILAGSHVPEMMLVMVSQENLRNKPYPAVLALVRQLIIQMRNVFFINPIRPFDSIR